MIFMNALNSHCMSRMRYISLVFLAALCWQTGLSAQTFESVLRRNFWNTSENVTGIRQDSLSRSYAEVFGGYGTGGFRDTWQPEEGWNAGAQTESIRHFERMSMIGSFSFEQNEYYGMCGSMFIDPGYYPIDVLEFTPGRKTLQTYTFTGGISYDVAPGWRIGAKMDFKSANIAKRKDLRYSNWKLDMGVAPGFMYSSGSYSIGAAAFFGKNTETIDAEQIGTAESSYYAFFDKGLMYGTRQVWTGSGVYLDESGVNGLPVKEGLYGGSLQFQRGNFYADLDIVASEGSVGEKEYVWFDFSGIRYGASLQYKKESRSSDHYFRMRLALKNQILNERVLEKDSENGVIVVTYHGSNRILSRETVSFAPEYEFVNDRMELLASVTISTDNGLASQMYPYVSGRSLGRYDAGIDALFHVGKFDFGASLGYGFGSLSEVDYVVDSDQEVQTAPYRLQNWYDRQMEYLTAHRLEAGLSVRWNFTKGMYLKAAGEWMHGFNLVHLSSPDCIGATLTIGYEF